LFRRLNDDAIIRQFWAEIADVLDQIEILHEDANFPSRNLAALVASKVYFNLESYEVSLNFALAAGDMFDVTERSEYVQMMINNAITQYSKQRQEGVIPDVRLDNMVNRMFQKVYKKQLQIFTEKMIHE
jgi:26S proteasome regulatory subunit N2